MDKFPDYEAAADAIPRWLLQDNPDLSKYSLSKLIVDAALGTDTLHHIVPRIGFVRVWPTRASEYALDPSETYPERVVRLCEERMNSIREMDFSEDYHQDEYRNLKALIGRAEKTLSPEQELLAASLLSIEDENIKSWA